MAAKKILTFKSSDVQALVDSAKAALEFRMAYGETYNPEYHFGGNVKKDSHGFPDSTNIDRSKIKPALWLVKDYGVYLMSNGVAPKDHVPGTSLPTAMSEECNPKNDNCYDMSRYIMGGDDCCQSLPIDGFELALSSNKPTIKIRVTARSIEIIG